MAQIEKQFNSFVKGLITEASALSFPANASLDEDNFVLNKDGSRYRRLGIDYELNNALISTGYTADIVKKARVSTYKWDSPGGDNTVSIGIVRVFNKLWFLNLLTANPSGNLLNGGDAITLSGLGNSEIDVAFINNVAVIVSKDLANTIVLLYNPTAKLVFANTIPLFVRDIWGVVDGLGVNERPTTLSDKHKYNLLNQGWTTNIPTVGVTVTVTQDPTPRPSTFQIGQAAGGIGTSLWATPAPKTVSTVVTGTAIEQTKTSLGYYPSNADVWTLGKTSDPTSANYQKYDPAIMIKNSLDNMYSPKASVIIDAYNRGSSRRNTTGIQTLPLDKELGRASTVASYASRIFYSGISSNITDGDNKSPNYNGYIFFSQVVTDIEKISLCYQDADPTSPTISDIIKTDGGTIQIPEASNILKLIPALGSLLVLAENGVWEIYGDTGGFTATSYQISKVSNISISNARSIINVDGSVFAWGKSGIFLIESDAVTGRYKATNLTLTTIQTYYNNISETARSSVIAFHDKKNNCIRWLYNNLTTYSNLTGISRFNKELVLDLTLKAFYPATIYYDEASSAPYVSDYMDMPGFSIAVVSDDIVVGSSPIILTNSDSVIRLKQDFSSQESNFKFLTTVGDSVTLSSYKNRNFKDWTTYNGTGFNYTSYLVTGYEIAQDLMRYKYVPYIFCYLEKTEDGFVPSGIGFDYKHPSSCLMQAQWQWNNTASGNKWGSTHQVYRQDRNYTPLDINDIFDNGQTVIQSKNKLRGIGKSLSIKFSSEEGKDLRLLGWAYPVQGGSRP